MKAAILEAPNDLRLGDAPDPSPGPGGLVVRVKAATICGTDIRILRGRKTAGVRYPSILGHEFAGEVAEADPASGFALGERVGVCPALPCGRCDACLRGRENLCPNLRAMGYEEDGAFAEYVRVPAEAVQKGCVHRLPDGMAFDVAALVEPLACVLNGQNQVGLGLGETVVVLGAGPIGTLHVKLARARGAARVLVSEPSAQRRAAALAAGADHALDPAQGDLRAQVRELNGGRGADVVICAIGIPALARQAIGLAGLGGRVSFFAGFSKGETAELDVNAIHYDEISVTGAFGLSRRDFGEALHLVAAGRIDVADMITHRYPLSDLQAAFGMAEGGGAMKVAILDA